MPQVDQIQRGRHDAQQHLRNAQVHEDEQDLAVPGVAGDVKLLVDPAAAVRHGPAAPPARPGGLVLAVGQVEVGADPQVAVSHAAVEAFASW